MGVEPTAACSAQPATSFEDGGAHRDTITPTHNFNPDRAIWVTIISPVIFAQQLTFEHFPGK